MSMNEDTNTTPTGGNSGERGRLGEDLAAQALSAHGLTVVVRNWRCQTGEIDIVARDQGTWVFVEVKLRQEDSFVSPEEAVSAKKRERLLRAALMYLAEHELGDVAWRIDVVAVEVNQDSKVERLDIYQDAIRADG